MRDRQNSKEIKPPDEEADPGRVQAPNSYYYDDSTGYETYDAGKDSDEDGVEEDESHPIEN